MSTNTPVEAFDACPVSYSGRRLRLFSILLCSFLLVGFILTREIGLSASFSNDFDEGVYLCSARNVAHGNPLFRSVFCSQPPAFVESLALAFRIFGESVAVGRTMIILFACLGLLSVGWIAWRVCGPLGAPLAIIGLGLPACFFQNARTCQAEIPSLALALVAIAAILASGAKRSGIWLMIGGVGFALGALSKLLIAPMILPLLFLLFLAPDSFPVNPWRTWRFTLVRTGAFGARLALFGVAGLVITGVFLLRYDLPSFYRQTIVFHQAASRAFPEDFHHNWAIMWHMILDAAGVAALAFIGLGVLWRRNRWAGVWLFLWLAATGSFLMAHSPLWERHSMLLLPPLAVAASATVLPLYEKGRIWFGLWVLAVSLISINSRTLAPALSVGRIWSGSPQVFPADEAEAMRLIREHTAPEDLVVTDQQMQAFRAGRMVPPFLCDTSFVRIQSGFLDLSQTIKAAGSARMIVFWTHRLDEVPGFADWVRDHYRVLMEFEGRTIFLRK